MVTQKFTFFPAKKNTGGIIPVPKFFWFRKYRFPLGGFSLILSGNAAFSLLYNIAAVKSK